MGKNLLKSNKEKKERLLSRDYILMMMSSMGMTLLNHFFLPTISPYMKLLTGRAVYGGIMMTIYSLSALAVRPLSGMISDKFGRQKLLIVGAFLCAASCLGLGLTTSLAVIFIIRGIMGIGFGMHSTCSGAVVSDILPKSRLAEGIGYFSLYSTAGQMIGPLIALAIVAGGEMGNYRNLFFTSMFLCLGSMLVSFGITYERKRKKERQRHENDVAKPGAERPAPGKPLPKTFLGFEYAVFAPGVVLILLYFGFTGVLSYMIIFTNWMGFGNSGLFFTFSATGVLVSRLLFGRIADRRGADIVVIPATAVLAACMILIPFMPSMTALVLLAIPIGLSSGAITPTMNSLVFRRCSVERQGTASGAFFAAVDIGIAAGSPILGLIVDAAGYRIMYWVSAAMVLLSLAAYLLLASDKRYYKRKAGAA